MSIPGGKTKTGHERLRIDTSQAGNKSKKKNREKFQKQENLPPHQQEKALLFAAKRSPSAREQA